MRRVICLCVALACLGAAALGGTGTASAAPTSRLAPTPPMGWNSYNAYACDNGSQNMEAVARFIHDSGLERDGYTYINSDGCYDDNEAVASPNTYGVFAPTPQDPETCGAINGRLPDGQLFVNAYLFPPSRPCANDGFKLVGDYVHSLGLKLGLYLDASNNWNCEEIPGSYGFDKIDASTLAGWGVDYVKADWGCSDSTVPPGSNAPAGYTGIDAAPGNQGFGGPTFSQNSAYNTGQENTQIEMYTALGQALAHSGRPILYSVAGAKTVDSQDWAFQNAGAVMDRPGGDSNANFSVATTNKRYAGSVVGIVNAEAQTYDALTGPEHWIDPDIMEVGNGSLTAAENRSEMSMFSEMANPLMISTNLCPSNCGPDTTPASQAQLAQDVSILGNRRVIAVDQDRLGSPAHIVGSFDGTHLTMAKPLADGSVAVTLFNESTTTDAMMSTSAGAIGLPAASGYRVEDLWTGQVTTTSGAISADVPATATAMSRVTAIGNGGAHGSGRQIHLRNTRDNDWSRPAAGGDTGSAFSSDGGLFVSMNEGFGKLPGNLLSVACASATQCTAGDILGGEVSFDPAASGSARLVEVDPGQSLVSVSCPAGAQLCVGLDRAGNVVSYTPGVAGRTRISAVDTGNEPTALNCPTATECVAVDGKGNEVTIGLQGAGARVLGVSAVDPYTYLAAVACPSSTQCTAVGGGGNNGDTVVTFDPAGGAVLGAGATSIDPDTGNGLSSIACPSASQCTAVDGDGNELTFDPLTATLNTAGIVALEGSGAAIGSGGGVMNSVSCPSDTQCTTVDDYGNEVTFDPTSGTIAAGGPQAIDPFGNGLEAVACQSSAGLCTAVDLDGNAVSFDPTTGAPAGAGSVLIDPARS